MKNPSQEPSPSGRKPTERPLRKGWTTGACAAASAAAAYRALLTRHFDTSVTIRLPRGETPTFHLHTHVLADDFARAGIIKDAGDDPDVTHGLEVIAEVRLGAAGTGLQFFAGDGVGTVTLEGLPLPPGEPAINPGPRQQIADALVSVALGVQRRDDVTLSAPLPDVEVTLSIPGGLEASKKTMNSRLGIIGGLSVLGTTGIVVPFSCSSWIHSIHRGIDVARAQNFTHVLASTGRTSEQAANALLALPEEALIDMGDFAGGLLKYVRSHPIERLTIAGGFAKIAKLAQGAMDLHSARSQIDFARLSALLKSVGGSPEAVHESRTAITAQRVLELAGDRSDLLAAIIARQAREVALATLAGGTDVEVWIYDRKGQRIGLIQAPEMSS
ncbi:cobalt-precorrin-5B (C(1))-methyltransferase [Magnetovibrio blakemorei]|uniref:Cobalt-precorrin-5B C(1)-methyltransferase n=2 Tax=Magnetovibrio blakemorei TaxID=28181 RepID=A0A1E5Q8T1_9PROT|nr:cobalt-precorrin-5B (C(1))-methyltransferase [Magnetovibrio blakemorei]